MSKTVPFQYYGSKSRQFEFINSRLPRTRQYVEPFGGAATVLINRQPVPVETYNDVHGDIPHFFRVLRDNGDELIDRLKKTPYARDEYAEAINARNNGYADCDDVERARLFFVIMQQSRGRHKFEKGSGSWRYTVGGRAGSASDNGRRACRNKIHKTLPEIAGRLIDLQIENRPATDVIDRHDRDTATFYADPPYPHQIRGTKNNYAEEMPEEEHRKLADVLDDCEGYVALSGYRCDLYDDLYADWYRYEDEERSIGDGTRTEVLWTNYDADELGGEKIGDWPEPTEKGKQLTLTGAVD